MRTNYLGAYLVSQAFLPMLKVRACRQPTLNCACCLSPKQPHLLFLAPVAENQWAPTCGASGSVAKLLAAWAPQDYSCCAHAPQAAAPIMQVPCAWWEAPLGAA